MSLLNIYTYSRLPRLFRFVPRQPSTWFHSTPILCAEPLKKKRKIDPQVIKHREERRKKKLEKQIRRLEKNARQLKPIEEIEVPLKLLDEKQMRVRNLPPLSEEELEKRYQLHKKWCQYKYEQKTLTFHIIDRLIHAQEKALQELRLESEELYQEAIQPDICLLPIKIKGPVATPPLEDYNSPDGEYILKTKKWD